MPSSDCLLCLCVCVCVLPCLSSDSTISTASSTISSSSSTLPDRLRPPKINTSVSISPKNRLGTDDSGSIIIHALNNLKESSDFLGSKKSKAVDFSIDSPGVSLSSTMIAVNRYLDMDI